MTPKIPDYAIICTPTIEERRELFEFLHKHGYHWAGRASLVENMFWENHREKSVCNIYPDKDVAFWDREGYLSCGSSNFWWPKDEALVFCSVAEFFAICYEFELAEEDDDEFLQLDDILC